MTREQLRQQRMDAHFSGPEWREFARRADAAPDVRYHEECGYAWAVHTNRIQANRRPFGCPTETEAVAAWGRS